MLAQIEGVTITILYPSYIPRARGVNAVAKFKSHLRAACSNDELELVQQVAHQLGLPVATFIRWCTVESAKQVLAHINKDTDRVQQDPKEP